MPDLEEQIASLKQERADLKAKAAAYEERIKRLERSVETRDSDNKELRDKLKESAAEITRLTAEIPKEGSVVITGEEATELGKYRELGSASEVTEKINRVETAEAKSRTLTRRDDLRKVADHYGWKLTVLERELGDTPYKIEEAEGETRFLVPRDGKTPQEIDEWMKENRSDYLPALQREPSQAAPTGSGRTPPAKPSARQDAAMKKQASF